ncbi:hypothetical protein LLH00_04890 [bacterium]|nr:hypothetical protein [bacterium]
MKKPVVYLLFISLLAALACSDNGKSSLVDPQASLEPDNIQIKDFKDPAQMEALTEQTHAFLDGLVAEGKVDTIMGDQYRVESLPANVPPTFRTMSVSIGNGDGQMTDYKYVLPFTCGRLTVYIFEWGQGGGYTACSSVD